jgi:phage N-6-adenine-methyltransferase
MLSNTPKEERDSARTPDHIFKYASKYWGPFDIDLASSDENHLCRRYFTKEDNALEKDWASVGDYGWCNPPYSNIRPWIDKAVEEEVSGFNTVFLLPAPNGEEWSRYLMSVCDYMCWIYPRVNFLRPDGEIMKGNPRGSIFAVIGESSDVPDRAPEYVTWTDF